MFRFCSIIPIYPVKVPDVFICESSARIIESGIKQMIVRLFTISKNIQLYLQQTSSRNSLLGLKAFSMEHVEFSSRGGNPGTNDASSQNWMNMSGIGHDHVIPLPDRILDFQQLLCRDGDLLEAPLHGQSCTSFFALRSAVPQV